jgi:aminopeptidase
MTTTHSTTQKDSPENGADRFAEQLAKLADLAVCMAVNLQPDQELIVTAPLEARELVHYVTKSAYQRGARLVTCLYDDPRMILDRLQYADERTLDYAPAWLSHGVVDALERGAARLFVVAPYPDLLTGLSADRIVRVHTSLGRAAATEMQFASESRINWSTVPFVTASWARTVFPDLPVERAIEKLWDAVFRVTRTQHPDPIAAWRDHDRVLTERRALLQQKGLSALHFHDGRSDLIVGLVQGHRWVGGSVIAGNGIDCLCNMPTEEVFTCPHRERTEGRLVFSKPLVIAGTLVEDVCIQFRAGAMVSLQAGNGQGALERLLATDEGSRRLGEVGLVPDSSLIAASRTLFYNPLFDENAASHVAFGQSYSASLDDTLGLLMTPLQRGANQSSLHIDCMLGTPDMSVDGLHAPGVAEPIMRGGEFVF